jgi:MFS family permease
MGRGRRGAKVIEPTYRRRRRQGFRSDCQNLPTTAPSRFPLFAAGLAAFCVYFAMYAFRKPVMAVAFTDQPPLWHLLDYKATLIVAQAIGYALSKMVGVRVVAEHRSDRRAMLILSLVGASWAALLGFALLPAWAGPLCLFLNGLPLGMIWGLVIRYLEGRRVSELLAAMLTASFILSSGATKTAGALLVQHGVSPFWMPAVAGLLFAPVLAGALAVLARTPPPDAQDRAERGVRAPMDRAARHAYLRAHALPLTALVIGYTLLTALRDFRDNFAAELWGELGDGAPAAIFSLTELPVTVVVLIGLALLAMVRSNLRALMAIHGAILFGALLLCAATALFLAGAIGPVAWMTLIGLGIYSAYAPFSAVLFDRMISLGRSPGNAGFLIYVADSFGYVGSVALLLVRELAEGHARWLGFFTTATMVTGMVLAVATLLSGWWFLRRFSPDK